jgi:hypothetical protein
MTPDFPTRYWKASTPAWPRYEFKTRINVSGQRDCNRSGHASLVDLRLAPDLAIIDQREVSGTAVSAPEIERPRFLSRFPEASQTDFLGSHAEENLI